MSVRVTVEVHLTNWKTIAAGATIAGSLGLATLGLGSGLANAAPSLVVSQVGRSQWGGWWDPPPPAYGYDGYGYDGGYGAPSACVDGPLGLVHVCA
jgi:hypothetical protein